MFNYYYCSAHLFSTQHFQRNIFNAKFSTQHFQRNILKEILRVSSIYGSSVILREITYWTPLVLKKMFSKGAAPFVKLFMWSIRTNKSKTFPKHWFIKLILIYSHFGVVHYYKEHPGNVGLLQTFKNSFIHTIWDNNSEAYTKPLD